MLDVGGELGEVEDLRDSGAGDDGAAGDLGLVFYLAGGKQVFQSDGEGHQFGDVGHSRRFDRSTWTRRRDASATVGCGGGLELGLDVRHWLNSSSRTWGRVLSPLQGFPNLYMLYRPAKGYKMQ